MRSRLHRPFAVALGVVTFLLVLGAGFMAAPSVPAAVKSVRLGGVNYVGAESFGARFGLQASTSDHGRKLTLRSKWTTIEFEADSRECAVNDLRVFLGDATRVFRGDIVISQIDADKLITPMLLPGDDEKRIPDLRLIVLDPGHGGGDPGKENRRLGVNEKTLALDTAKRLQRALEQAGYKVIMTRTDDRQLGPDKVSDLQHRAEIANKAGADLFISLHYNAVEAGANRVTGVEVYTLTPQRQYSTADPEHEDDRGAAEFNPGNRYDHWNTVLGYQVHRKMIEDLHASDRGLKRARWAVLRNAECPAILIESGFLSNDSEARRIATPAYRQQIAEAIADGVQAYGNVIAGIRKQRG